MRLILCLSFVLASSVWAADQAADLADIQKVISTLNTSPDSAGLFTDDFADRGVLISLGVYREHVRVSSNETPGTIHVDALGLCASHQPMGELEPCPSTNVFVVLASSFEVKSIRLVTPDVALVDAVNDRAGIGVSRHTPVLLVLRKERGAWRIASIRVVAPPAAAR